MEYLPTLADIFEEARRLSDVGIALCAAEETRAGWDGAYAGDWQALDDDRAALVYRLAIYAETEGDA
jgi:hypothetical protein